MTQETATPAHPEPGLAGNVLNLRKVYYSHAGETLALNGLTASFRAGQFTAVVGPSGSGKTTLFNCLTGLDRPTSGQVALGPHNIGTMPQAQLTQLRRGELGLVLEDEDLVGSLSVRENLLLPSQLARHTPDKAWLESVIDAAGLRDVEGASPVRLSPSQQQRAAVARALVGRPRVLVADEPTGRLTADEGDELLGLLLWARRHCAQTLVVLTQNLLVAAEADRALFLADGQVVADIHEPTRFSVISKFAELASRRAGASGR